MAEQPILKLKSARTGKLASLTKRINKAQGLMKTDASTSIINSIGGEIEKILAECEKLNLEMIELLEDEKDMTTAFTWYTDAEETANDCRDDIQLYVEKKDQHMTGTHDPLTPQQGQSQSKSQYMVQPVVLAPLDEWIDKLIPFQETEIEKPNSADQSNYQDLMLRAMFERDAPKPVTEPFDGSPIHWPKFMESFFENVHRQPYFNDVRRMSILQNLVKGRAKDIISGLGNDGAAYAVALKELKNWCGHRSQVVQAFMERVTNGPILPDHDRAQLHSFYVHVRDCIFTARRMGYESDLGNSDVLRRTTLRLPVRVRDRWAESCYKIRLKQKREPTLGDLEEWLHFRTAAAYDPILPPDAENPSQLSGHVDATSMRTGPSEDLSTHVQPGEVPDPSYAARNDREPPKNPPPGQGQLGRPLTNNRYCTFHKASGHWSRSCNSLRRKSIDDQVQWFKDSKVCRICLGEGHGMDGSKCPIVDRLPTCYYCEKKHHGNFHDVLEILRKDEPGATAIYSTRALSLGDKVSYKSALSPAITGYIQLESKSTIDVGILLDTGSVITLVTKKTVKLANLTKVSDKPYNIVMETVGGSIQKMEAFAYKIPLVKKGASSITPTYITGYGVDKIGSQFPKIELAQAAAELGIQPTSLSYPSGLPLDILVGIDNAHLCHPSVVKTPKAYPSLVYGKTDIGFVLFGSHPSFIKDAGSGHYRVIAYSARSCDISDLYSTEAMGVECSPKCGSCKCGNCAAGSGVLSLKEEREYQAIRSLLKLENGVVVADYPWIKNPRTLPDHYSYAFKRLVQFENRMLKSPNLALFKEQFQKMLDTGVYRRLTPEEDEAWRANPENPVHYLPYREVLKPSSTTTPLRIILDPASAPDGKCINDYWATGPKLILNPIGLQIRHREEAIAIGNDINRMYNEVRTTPMIYHCHRVLYREFEQTREPETFVVVRNSFGSRPSGTVAIAATHLVAEVGQENYPLGAEMIKTQSYVDDLLDSKSDMGIAKQTMEQTEKCLALGSFTLKKWTVVDANNLSVGLAEDCESLEIRSDTETVLGVHWEVATDSFKILLKLNLSKKKRKQRTGPDLQEGEIFQLVEPLTLRKILSQVNGFYDPLGFVAPYICELKFVLGKLWKIMNAGEKESSSRLPSVWDTPIPMDCDQEWRKLLNTAFHLKELRFPRVLRPKDAVGHPWLIIMTDSSMKAFGACAYVRFQRADGSYFCRLIAAKSRIWPIEPNDFISLCRGELQGAVLGNRLAATILSESRYEFERTIFILDSEIVRAQISKDSHSFDTFVANRVGEIRAKFSPEQFYTVGGEENVSADLLSRGTIIVSKMDSNSEWQNGPKMLYKHFRDWPISQKYNSAEPLPESRDFTFNQQTMTCQTPEPPEVAETIPVTCDEPFGDCSWTEAICAWNTYLNQNDQEHSVRTLFNDEMETKIIAEIDISRYSTLAKLFGVTYRFLHTLSWKPGDGHFGKFMAKLKIVNADQLELAAHIWIRDAQRSLSVELKTGKYNSLKPDQDPTTRIWHLNGRFGEHPEGYHPIILPNDHPFVVLLVTNIHERSHCGVTATAAKVKNEYHVLGVKNLAKTVRKNCTICRRVSKSAIKVPMAPYPVERFRPAYAFEHSSCDLFGPFSLQVPGRVTRGRPMDSYGKGYGIIFTCLSSRAVHLELMEGQDTSAFLMALRRFASIRGQPRYIWSDNGAQIVAADQELQDIVKDWDQTKLKQFGAHNGIKFEYAAPAAPWQNGVSEALIRSVKNSLAQTFNSKPRMPVMNLQTILYEIAAVLNERPINLGHETVPGDWDCDTNSYLCPNQLLLGRSSVRIPSGPFTIAQSKHAELFHEIQKLVNEWWQKWNEFYLPTLLRQSKWHSESRKVKVGDIVFVKDRNALRSDWKIAEISKVLPSEKDDRIRNVELRYKCLPDEPLTKYSGCKSKFEIRDVKTLVILLTAEERKIEN